MCVFDFFFFGPSPKDARHLQVPERVRQVQEQRDAADQRRQLRTDRSGTRRCFLSGGKEKQNCLFSWENSRFVRDANTFEFPRKRVLRELMREEKKTWYVDTLSTRSRVGSFDVVCLFKSWFTTCDEIKIVTSSRVCKLECLFREQRANTTCGTYAYIFSKSKIPTF